VSNLNARLFYPLRCLDAASHWEKLPSHDFEFLCGAGPLT